MKQYFVFIIVCCLGVQLIFGKPKGKEKELVQKCAQELKIDEEKYETVLENDDDTTCLFACMTRNLAVRELIGPNNTATLHNVSLKMINIAYEAGYDNVSALFNHQDALNQVEICYTPERTECAFFKCLNIKDAPWYDVMNYVSLKDLQGGVFNSL